MSCRPSVDQRSERAAAPGTPVMFDPTARPKGKRVRAMKYVGSVLGIAGVRVVNAWFYHTPLDVLVERTVLMILLVYLVSVLRAPRRGPWVRFRWAARRSGSR